MEQSPTTDCSSIFGDDFFFHVAHRFKHSNILQNQKYSEAKNRKYYKIQNPEPCLWIWFTFCCIAPPGGFTA